MFGTMFCVTETYNNKSRVSCCCWCDIQGGSDGNMRAFCLSKCGKLLDNPCRGWGEYIRI